MARAKALRTVSQPCEPAPLADNLAALKTHCGAGSSVAALSWISSHRQRERGKGNEMWSQREKQKLSGFENDCTPSIWLHRTARGHSFKYLNIKNRHTIETYCLTKGN